MSHCHNKFITHRDIKPENILINDAGVAKLVDFGFSTFLPNEKKKKIFCGTPSFMAPEILLKREHSGPPSDIWSLGIMLYMMLAGRVPFKGKNEKDLERKI